MAKKIAPDKKRSMVLGGIGLLSALLVIIQGCGGGGGGGGNDKPSSKKAWTYMVYMAGDNNLSSAAYGDINEMEQVGSSDALNIVVQVEFSQQYSEGLPANTLRGSIAKDSNENEISSSLKDVGNKNMGDKTTLSEFITWAKTTYPADHYALVLWDHGAGWKADRMRRGAIRGALEDATSGSFMSLPDIADGVEAGGLHFDLINFDACLMAMYEVAYEFNGLADYMVFSEEVEPGEGDPYHTILRKLADNAGMSALTLCQTITTEFKTFYELQNRTSVTKSAVDMSHVTALHDAISGLAVSMNESIGTERPNIQSARDLSVQYAYPENHDIGDFLDHLWARSANESLREKISGAKSLLSTMIVSNIIYSPNAGEPISRSTGLSIYLPKRDQVTDEDLTQYGLLAINQSKSLSDSSWGGFINQLITGDEGDGVSSLETKPGNFIIWLEWDTDADLDLLVWEPDGTFAAPYIGASSPNGFLSEDSAFSGSSIEYYAAAEMVETGDYDVLVQYYSDGSIPAGWTTAYLYLYDPEEGYTDFVLIDARLMSLNGPAPEAWYEDNNEILNVINGAYSDWWIPCTLTRATPAAGLSLESVSYSTEIAEKTISIRFNPSKLKKMNRKKSVINSGDTMRLKEKMKQVNEEIR